MELGNSSMSTSYLWYSKFRNICIKVKLPFTDWQDIMESAVEGMEGKNYKYFQLLLLR